MHWRDAAMIFTGWCGGMGTCVGGTMLLIRRAMKKPEFMARIMRSMTKQLMGKK